ncbi:hypothetical protein ACFLR2_01075, partial [Chlamydiota bacterium]
MSSSSVTNNNNAGKAPQLLHPQGHVHQPHCKRYRTPAPTPRTIEEGVRTIEIILTQSVLC